MNIRMDDKKQYKKTSISIRMDIHRKAKAASALSHTAKNFQEWMEEAIEEKLKREGETHA